MTVIPIMGPEVSAIYLPMSVGPASVRGIVLRAVALSIGHWDNVGRQMGSRKAAGGQQRLREAKGPAQGGLKRGLECAPAVEKARLHGVGCDGGDRRVNRHNCGANRPAQRLPTRGD